jgi:hypothetical protein
MRVKRQPGHNSPVTLPVRSTTGYVQTEVLNVTVSVDA